MRKLVIRNIIVFLASSMSWKVAAIENQDLIRSFNEDENASPFNRIYNEFGYLPYHLVESSNDIYYGLSGNGSAIALYDLKNKTTPVGWPLDKEQLLLNKEQDTTGPTNPEPTNQGRYETPEMWLAEGYENSSGCLSQTPLRYADVNGEKRLFVFSDPSVVVFSPTRGKVDINLMFAREDVMPQAQYDQYMSTGHFILKDVVVPQQAALSSVASSQFNAPGKDWLYPAQRSYGKIYFGDFNNDNIGDILMWRKLYYSRPKSDPVIGYKLDAEMYAHFTLVNGEYQLQTDTDPLTVQNWLAANNQTWQSGFPSKSECAGQENQLIPDMHDPLLNDPDVLK